MTVLTERFAQAVDYARIAHASQFRKGTQIPYVYHLLGVASMVLEYGGNEDQAIAGLLHDVLEDCGEHHAATIRTLFGEAVANIVQDCTDGTAESKERAQTPEAKRTNWQIRKIAYLAHLARESESSLLVSGCDKLHNARAVLNDLEGTAGIAVFERFTGRQDGTLQYYEAIARILTARQAPMADAFDGVVERMHQLAGTTERVPLT